jgi:protein phosphatase
MLCSDGLTGMVHEPELKPLLEDRSRSLEQTGRKLIAAANEAGGRDNITVILFRLEEVEDRRGGGRSSSSQATAEYDTYSGEAVQRQGASRPTTEQAVEAGDDTEAEYRRHGTVALQAVRPRAEPREERAPPPERTAPLPDAPGPERKRRKRSGGLLLLFLAVILPVLVGAWLATRAVYFVGTDPDAARMVTIYRGLPYELPFGIDLYEEWYQSGVPLVAVPANRRDSFTHHKLRSRDDAEELVIALEKGQVE